jgi:hypothetical protein
MLPMMLAMATALEGTTTNPRSGGPSMDRSRSILLSSYGDCRSYIPDLTSVRPCACISDRVVALGELVVDRELRDAYGKFVPG